VLFRFPITSCRRTRLIWRHLSAAEAHPGDPTPIDKLSGRSRLQRLPAVRRLGYSVDVWFDKLVGDDETSHHGSLADAPPEEALRSQFASTSGMRWQRAQDRGPPMHTFSGPSLTKEQRQAGSHLYRRCGSSACGRTASSRGSSRSTALASAFVLHGHLCGAIHRTVEAPPASDLGRKRCRDRYSVTEFGSFFRLHFKSTAGKRVFSGRPIRKGRFFQPSDASGGS